LPSVTTGADPSRFLGPAYGYASWSGNSPDQLEAIRPDEQEEQTRRAHRDWAVTQARRWGACAAAISAALDAFYGNGAGIDRKLQADLRQIRRGSDRVGRKLDDEVRRATGQ
jgi:hypothetical protein